MKGLDVFQADSYYHVVNHAVGNENLFCIDDNYRYFLQKYASYILSVAHTYAYCLMPNHIHFLIKTHSGAVLKEHPKYKGDYHKLIMQELSNLLNAYAKAYNKRYERKGALWIDYTKRFLIESDNYLNATINYIHQNPVKHGFVKSPDEWLYSSYSSMLSSQKTLLQRKEVIDLFGNKEMFILFHKEKKAPLQEEWEH